MLYKFSRTILKGSILDTSALEGSPKKAERSESQSGAGDGTNNNGRNEGDEDPKLNSSELVARIENNVNMEALNKSHSCNRINCSMGHRCIEEASGGPKRHHTLSS